jgi:hypothetical protein
MLLASLRGRGNVIRQLFVRFWTPAIHPACASANARIAVGRVVLTVDALHHASRTATGI